MTTKPERWAVASFTVRNHDAEPFTIAIKGRDRWALESLMAAGDKGCTPIDRPGPRWSAYVFNLRELGVRIDTNHEAHGGPFKGTHARYVLRSTVTAKPDTGRAAA